MYNSAMVLRMVLGCSVSEFCRPATGQKKWFLGVLESVNRNINIEGRYPSYVLFLLSHLS